METYQDRQAKLCENHMSLTANFGVPHCNGNKEVQLTIIYNDGPLGRDTMALCKQCSAKVSGESRKYGYKAIVKKYSG